MSASVRPAPPQAPRPVSAETGLLGRPRWFNTLFGTDVWERFSFYGMTALLVLYATEPAAEGGLGLSNGDAALLYGLYMASVFLASLPGGWLGDRILGAHRAVLYGAFLIMCGHLAMAVPAAVATYPGLLLIALGTGLLKPNMAGMLSGFYARVDRAGRDAAFSLFYMSVQVSALVAPLIVGVVGETVNWHLGFSLAALGMALGLLQYVRGSRHFGDVGMAPDNPATPAQRAPVLRYTGIAVAVVVLGYGADALAGSFSVAHLMPLVGALCVVTPVCCFWRLLRNPALTADERTRVRAYIWIFLASAAFWALFLQAGSVFALFAKESTDRQVLGYTMPASWFQAALPLAVLLTAPLFAWLWKRGGDRIETIVKYTIGMGATAAAYLVMALAALAAASGDRVSPLWLVLAFLLLGAGEVAFAPVGMSATTAVAPAGFTNQMVALFWLAGALGGGLGGNALKLSGDEVPGPGYFLVLGLAILAVGAGLFLARRPLTRKLTAGGA